MKNWEALKALMEGSKIRRRGWIPDVHWSLAFRMIGGMQVSRVIHSGTRQQPDLGSIFENNNDWEIYAPKPLAPRNQHSFKDTIKPKHSDDCPLFRISEESDED